MRILKLELQVEHLKRQKLLSWKVRDAEIAMRKAMAAELERVVGEQQAAAAAARTRAEASPSLRPLGSKRAVALVQANDCLRRVSPRLYPGHAAPCRHRETFQGEVLFDGVLTLPDDKVKYSTDGNPLGTGGEAEVFKGVYSVHNSWGEQPVKVAVKVMKKKTEQSSARLVDEVRLLGTLAHPNVVRTFGVHATATTTGAVLELCEGGSLADAIANGGLEADMQQRVVRELAGALAYLHRAASGVESKPVVIHADLKPDNILLTKELVVKVGDFGLSNKHVRDYVGGGGKEAGGTREFRSPEAWLGRKLTTKADVYSYACVLVCVACGVPVPYTHTKEKLRELVPVGKLRPELPATHAWHQLVVACGECDPRERWSSDDVVRYFKGVS